MRTGFDFGTSPHGLSVGLLEVFPSRFSGVFTAICPPVLQTVFNFVYLYFSAHNAIALPLRAMRSMADRGCSGFAAYSAHVVTWWVVLYQVQAAYCRLSLLVCVEGFLLGHNSVCLTALNS